MVSGPVIEVVKGGLIVDIGLRGFLPASLVELRRVRELQPYVGKVIEAKIIELDRNRNNVVLSRRAWLEEAQKEQRGDFLANLKPGERRKGVVSSVVNFGAFVDLGGMDGLVHVSELSWKHVDHPTSVVAVGDEIEVEVLDVDLEKERISLSLKATQSDPWQEFADSHAVGQLVYGRITKLVPFGAFVQVGDGIEGLVHISEMAVHHVDLPEQVVTPGEELWVKIIDIDLQRRRISLSIKQAAEGGEVSEEYREAFGEHAYDDEGNYIGFDYAEGEFTPETEAQAAWADFAVEAKSGGAGTATEEGGEAPADAVTDAAPEAEDAPAAEAAVEPAAEAAPEPAAEVAPEPAAEPVAEAAEPAVEASTES
jgi:small subunit ribosomal protein S1